jgi:hypothetical protein
MSSRPVPRNYERDRRSSGPNRALLPEVRISRVSMHVDRQHTCTASVATTNHRYRFMLLICKNGAVADLDCHRTQPTTRRNRSASPPARERNAEKRRRPAWPPACAVRRQRTHRTNGAWDLTTNTGFVSLVSINVGTLGEDGWLSLGVRPLPPVCSPFSIRPQSGPPVSVGDESQNFATANIERRKRVPSGPQRWAGA